MKDIILLVGSMGSGKTYAANVIQEQAKVNDLAIEAHTISDTTDIVKTMAQGDENGGRHHTHNWVSSKDTGH